jgi:hypothetical protein
MGAAQGVHSDWSDSIWPETNPNEFVFLRLTARVTGGWRDEIRSRNGQNPKPRKSQKNGENLAVRVHAVLGCVSESLRTIDNHT